MTHLYIRPPRYDRGDDCPPPYHGRVIVTQPPAHARLTVPSPPPPPPCTPRGGINTDWSGNKCAILHEGPSQPLAAAAQPAPQAQPPPPEAKADPGTVAHAVQPTDDHVHPAPPRLPIWDLVSLSFWLWR
jgi:hypothetical protein